jgi:hypothetical protein
MQLATNETTTTTSTPPMSNAPSHEDIMGSIKVLATEDGRGRDSQIRFALTVINAAYLGTASLAPDKHGKGRSDALVYAEHYVRIQSGAVIFDRRANKTKKLVSNTKKYIEVGVSTQWGRGQPMQFVEEFADFMKAVRNKDPSALKKCPNGKTEADLNDAVNGLLRLLTAQKKSPRLFTEDERNAYAFKTERDPKTEMEKLMAIHKSLEKTGDKSVQIEAAKASIKQRVAAIVKGVK